MDTNTILLKSNQFKKVAFIEIPVSMDYPSTGKYTKIRPIIDWYIMAKFWIKGLTNKNEL